MNTSTTVMVVATFDVPNVVKMMNRANELGGRFSTAWLDDQEGNVSSSIHLDPDMNVAEMRLALVNLFSDYCEQHATGGQEVYRTLMLMRADEFRIQMEYDDSNGIIAKHIEEGTF